MTDSAQAELDKMVAIFQDHAASNGYPMNDEHKRGAEIHKKAILNWHNKQSEAVLDRLGKRVSGLEIDVEMTMRQINLLEISEDELAQHSLNIQIEADDRKAVLDDVLSAIEAERNKLKEFK